LTIASVHQIEKAHLTVDLPRLVSTVAHLEKTIMSIVDDLRRIKVVHLAEFACFG
jgi:hypothetical protein